jgi:hypothetical protein
MKTLFSILLLGALSCPAAAAYEDEGLSEAAVSTDTIKNGEEEDGQAVIQENDEDLAAFVTDYIRKDIQLKGAFFLEEKTSRKLLKLSLASVEQKAASAEGGVKLVAASFKDAAGKKYTAMFHLQNGPWGGLDIFKIELKTAPAKTSPAKN